MSRKEDIEHVKATVNIKRKSDRQFNEIIERLDRIENLLKAHIEQSYGAHKGKIYDPCKESK